MARIVLWTEAEDAILREYPTRGLAATAARLPGRSRAAINYRCSIMGLKLDPGVRGHRRMKAPRTQPVQQLRSGVQAAPVARVAKPLERAAPPPPLPSSPPSAPKRAFEVVKAADIRPGMIVNRYPVGTSAAPALREVLEARFSDSGSRVFFNLAWRQVELSNGKREMPAACWDFYRVPDLSFEVYPAIDALDRKVRP